MYSVLYLISYILFSLPSVILTNFPNLSIPINSIKLTFGVLIFLLYIFKILKDKKPVSRLIKDFVIYAIFIFVVTCIRGVNLSVLIKNYLLNFSGILLIDLIFTNDNKALKYIYRYNSVLIILNILIIFLDKLFFANYIVINYSEYLLGSDNRFILYFLIQIVLLINLSSGERLKDKLIFWYGIGSLTLLVVWSVSAFVVFTTMFIVELLLFKYNKKININLLLWVVVGLSLCVVYLHIQNLASHFIVDVLHKTTTLSYRTNIWDNANGLIFKNPISLMFGYGFQDMSKVFFVGAINKFGIPIVINPIHMHNLIVNVLYDGGIIGLFLYFKMYLSIVKTRNIKYDNLKYNTLGLVLISLQVLMIFDVFEFYPLYYMILAIIFAALNQKAKLQEVENEKS